MSRLRPPRSSRGSPESVERAASGRSGRDQAIVQRLILGDRRLQAERFDDALASGKAEALPELPILYDAQKSIRERRRVFGRDQQAVHAIEDDFLGPATEIGRAHV